MPRDRMLSHDVPRDERDVFLVLYDGFFFCGIAHATLADGTLFDDIDPFLRDGGGGGYGSMERTRAFFLASRLWISRFLFGFVEIREEFLALAFLVDEPCFKFGYRFVLF